jgi:hypothetical protein
MYIQPLLLGITALLEHLRTYVYPPINFDLGSFVLLSLASLALSLPTLLTFSRSLPTLLSLALSLRADMGRV